MAENVHTVKRDDGWGNIREGGDRVAKIYPIKAEATAAGKATAKRDHVEHVIHNADGKIGSGSSSKQSYGHDPKNVKG